MGDSVQSLAEAKVNIILCSPHVYLAGHAIIEGHQIGQALFPLGESMLTTPDNLLFLQYLRGDIQNELFHHLSKDWGEADRPVALWVLCLALFEDWGDADFPPVLRHISCSSWVFKVDEDWLSNDICQLLQLSWVHPIEASGFFCFFLCLQMKPYCLFFTAKTRR